ncbi:hypothetical protein [Rugamonas sp.]|uniref:hypothetical protein n=1 Tax=Rugamonas sp. TaxID=1926287 RepID=UPI0025F6B381|nr:hypothetical protein [Rugamonas sp.]
MNQSPETPVFQKKGSVNKCPSCGAQLGAFVSACQSCGHEFTDVDANRSITALVARFDEIEREVDDKGIKGRHRVQAVTDKRARVIRDFPVPNSRDDLRQLMFFIQPKIVQSVQPDPNIEDWRSKFMEVLNRARHAYKNDDSALAEFDGIAKSLEGSVAASMRIKARRNPVFAALAVGAVLLALAGMVSSRLAQNKVQECEDQYTASARIEAARLEKIAASADQGYQGRHYADAAASAGKLYWDLADAACKSVENQHSRFVWDGKRAKAQTQIEAAVAAETAQQSAAADHAAAEQVAAEQRVAAAKQAVERQAEDAARVVAQKEKAKEVEKKW